MAICVKVQINCVEGNSKAGDPSTHRVSVHKQGRGLQMEPWGTAGPSGLPDEVKPRPRLSQ